MVRRVLLVAATLLSAADWPSSGLAAQSSPVPPPRTTAPVITVGVRPDRVRVGDPFIVTVRVVAGAWPDAVEIETGPTAEMIDVKDRSSTGVGVDGVAENVFERDFQVVARVPGEVTLPGVLVDFAGEVHEVEVPPVTVAPVALDWGTPGGSRKRRGGEERLLPEGAPPRVEGRTYDATQPSPQGWPTSPLDPSWNTLGGVPPGPGFERGLPYGPGLGAYDGSQPYRYGGNGGYGVYGGYGRLPPGEGWAETAPSDPWWPELIPELGYYQSLVEDPDGLAALQTGLTPERVFVGQQATLVATATFPPEARARMSRDPEFFPAGASDAWVVDVPFAPAAPAAMGGRLEQAHTFLRAYFPLRAGVLAVDPAVLTYSTGAGTGRPPMDTLSSGSLSVEVMPIPEAEAPPTWTGAIGRYRIAAWLTPERVGWGESALLMVEIAGVGHLPSQPRPDPGPVWGGGLRPLGERAWVEVRDGVVGGVKRFTWLVVPVETGAVRIGPVFYSFFDPYIGAFGQVISQEVTLQVDAYPRDPRGTRPGPGAVAGGGDAIAGSRRGSGDPFGADALGGYADPYALPDPVGRAPGADAWVRDRIEMDASAFDETPTDEPGSRMESDNASAGRGSAGVSGSGAARPETEARLLLERVAAQPEDPDGWYALGLSYARGRPDEGWAEWAWRSGLRASPRDMRLREALWGYPSWRSEIGTPLVPLRAREAAFATAIALILGGAFSGAGVFTLLRTSAGAAGRSLVGVGLVLLTGGLLTLSSWAGLRSESAGVLVGGETPLRRQPTATAAVETHVSAGEAVRKVEEYGAWLRVVSEEGASGWVEAARFAPLASFSSGSSPALQRGRPTVPPSPRS